MHSSSVRTAADKRATLASASSGVECSRRCEFLAVSRAAASVNVRVGCQTSRQLAARNLRLRLRTWPAEAILVRNERIQHSSRHLCILLLLLAGRQRLIITGGWR